MKQKIDMGMINELLRKLYGMHPMVVAVREMLQNSKDAGSTKIKIKIQAEDRNSVWVICTDNGKGMDLDTVENAFMTIGNPHKELTSGNTGRFGVGIKVAINSNAEWYVRTNNLRFDSEFLKDEDRKPDVVEFIQGTEVGALVRERFWEGHIDQVIRMIYFSEVDVELEVILPSSMRSFHDMHAGCLNQHRRLEKSIEEFDCYAMALHTSAPLMYPDACKGYNIYRINGLVQCFGRGSTNRLMNLIFDLKPRAGKNYPLTPSRESLDYDVSEKALALVSKYDVDLISSEKRFTEPEPQYTKVDGRLLKGKRSKSIYPKKSVEEVALQKLGEQKLVNGVLHRDVILTNGMSMTMPVSKITCRPMQEVIEEVFFSETTTQIVEQEEEVQSKTPKLLLRDYRPASAARRKQDVRILSLWQELLLLVCDDDDSFGIGLTTAPTADHASRVYDGGDYFYLLNPKVLDEIQSADGKVLRLWGLACHEAAHHMHEIHNEHFSSYMGKIMAESSDIVAGNLRRLKKFL